VLNPRGEVPAQATCAADKQGKFHDMYNAIWDKARGDLGEENMVKLAKEIGLNTSKFQADMKGDCQKVVREDQQEMARVGVSGTPAFYINGRFLSGARPIEQFKALIDEELKKANERVGKEGTTAANYYQKWVVEKGKKTM
jgi:protein-disulfide isomerase